MNIKDIILFRLENATDTEKKAICKHLGLEYTKNIEKIDKEYRSAAGHSIVNVFRKQKLPYKQILIDVADKLHSGLGWTHFKLDDNYTELDIEKKILDDAERKANKFKEKWMSLSEEKRQENEKKLREKLAEEGYDKQTIKSLASFVTLGGAGITGATPVALSIFYSSFFGSTMAGIFGVSLSSLITGGIISASVVSAPLAIAYMSIPAYRKTIPVTLVLIQIGKRIEIEENL